MRLRLISAIAAFATLAPVMAHATASEASGFSWTGMFLGINAGYGRGSSDWDLSGPTASGSSNRTIDGGFIGLQAGYNAQLQNNLVAGIEATVQATDIGGKKNCSGNSCDASINSLSDISGRLGVNYNTSLLFLKGGLAYQNMEHKITGSGDDKGGSLGFIAGAGVEFYIDNNITSNIEYNYYHFNSDSSQVGSTHINDSDNLSLVKAGLNIKFN